MDDKLTKTVARQIQLSTTGLGHKLSEEELEDVARAVLIRLKNEGWVITHTE